MLGGKPRKDEVPILGLLQTHDSTKSGRVVVYGDSNCIDNSHLQRGKGRGVTNVSLL